MLHHLRSLACYVIHRRHPEDGLDWGYTTSGPHPECAPHACLQAWVMLCSTKVAALGLNLTMASEVIILDPWWNAAYE